MALIGNPDSGLGQAQKCGRVKMLNMIQTTPSDNWISGDNVDINQQ
jgi:hypothetical protein